MEFKDEMEGSWLFVHRNIGPEEDHIVDDCKCWCTPTMVRKEQFKHLSTMEFNKLQEVVLH